ncbi:MAG TPA: hypothetical protein VGO46_08345 [Gemmatimonadaceae bacterium]|nr:hypothetical protein [Gemmatimonadaceae bacterium]
MKKARLETLVERRVYAEDGTAWRVRETRLHDVPGALEDSCLICDSGKVCRRVWDYPQAWTELPTVELFKILDHPRRRAL